MSTGGGGGGSGEERENFLRNTILTLFLTLFKTQREVRWEPWAREPEGGREHRNHWREETHTPGERQ